MSRQNLYQMYVQNGNKVGFYVIRNSWSNHYAKVIEIGGQTAGELSGEPPYYDNPPAVGELYSLNTGRCIKKREALTCPGTFGYSLFAGDPKGLIG